MNQYFFHQGRPWLRRVLDNYPLDDENFKMLKAVSFGCMGGTAVASPVLFEEFRNIWFLDVSVFFISSAAFMWQSREEIKTYGAFTLVAATFLGLAAYSSARTPLKELVPWLPIALCLFILLTVFFFPKVRRIFNGGGGDEPQFAMEEGRALRFAHSIGTSVEPGSIQSEEDNRSQQQSLNVAHWIDHETSHMRGVDWSTSQQDTRLSTRGSDIDLDERQSVASTAPRGTRQGSLSPESERPLLG